jgi:hypothetical protein
MNINIRFIKSVNSTRLGNIDNSLNTGIRAKINMMKLNRNNRNLIVLRVRTAVTYAGQQLR